MTKSSFESEGKRAGTMVKKDEGDNRRASKEREESQHDAEIWR